MIKLFVRHVSADDVALFLRDDNARGVTVLPPPSEPCWVGVLETETQSESVTARAQQLAEKFGIALVLAAEGEHWRLEVVNASGTTTIRSSEVQRDDARKAAQTIAAALENPRVTTNVARVLQRPQGAQVAFERIGESLGLPCCGWKREDIEADETVEKLRVDGSKVIGKLKNGAAGPGYTHVSELLEDLAVPLFADQRYEAALKLLRGYDVHLTAEDGALRCKAPSGMITETLRNSLTQHKDDLVKHLS